MSVNETCDMVVRVSAAAMVAAGSLACIIGVVATVVVGITEAVRYARRTS
jgi:hypothetical protein